MTKWLKIVEGVVESVSIEQPEAEILGQYVTGPDDVYAGFSYDGEVFSPPPASLPSSVDVNAERDRRTAAGFAYNGKMYDFDVRAKADIAGAAQMAVNSMLLKGKQPTDDHWHGGVDPFVWITQDNSMTVMDAITTLQFGEAAARHQSAHIFAARALKDMNPIPLDFQDDSYWP